MLTDLIHSIWGAIHLAAAVTALVLGPILFLRVKGGASHRQLGYAYVAAMVITCLAGLPMDAFGAVSPFHILSIVSLATIALGAGFIFAAARIVRRPASRKGLTAGHMHFMAWSYIGLAAAGFAQIGSRIAADSTLFGVPGWSAVIAASALTIAAGAYLTRRAEPGLAKRYFPDG